MSRVPWDEQHERRRAATAASSAATALQTPLAQGGEEAEEVRDLQKDAVMIGKTFIQGFAIGGISGSVFGLADVMMDVKAMSAGKTNHAPVKVFRFGTTLGVFLSSYYGIRQTLYLYNPYIPTVVNRDGMNDLTAAFVAFVPLAVYGPMRRYLPYAALLLGFDYVSSNK